MINHRSFARIREHDADYQPESVSSGDVSSDVETSEGQEEDAESSSSSSSSSNARQPFVPRRNGDNLPRVRLTFSQKSRKDSTDKKRQLIAYGHRLRTIKDPKPDWKEIIWTCVNKHKGCKAKAITTMFTPNGEIEPLRVDEWSSHLLKDSGPLTNRFFIFSTESNLDLMCRYRNWSGDGTFSVAAKFFYQLYTIHVHLTPSADMSDMSAYLYATKMLSRLVGEYNGADPIGFLAKVIPFVNVKQAKTKAEKLESKLEKNRKK